MIAEEDRRTWQVEGGAFDVSELAFMGNASNDTEWKSNWPAITVTGWRWGETLGGDEKLEILCTVGDHQLALGGYEDGEVFEAAGMSPVGVFELQDWFELPDDDFNEMDMALAGIRRDFEWALMKVTGKYMDEAREAVCKWLTRELGQSGTTLSSVNSGPGEVGGL